ncbi:hypothetical protein HK100_004964 [Physocladia obscura]|uniref:Major facilitator superfamily (MFS) profile domain-containing protein n=1 Tax=Physocladia obscura TaxID=109957 RepID=A0AAD5T727_9FUNG|nr:hypothetical protein HK100_004964 [Physocladia obscura]
MGIPTNKLIYAYFICVVASMSMFMYGYDASTFNTVNGFATWNAFFGDGTCKSKTNATVVCSNVLGNVNTGYTVGAIFTGFFIAPIISDLYGRKLPLAIGAIFIVGFTFMQTFANDYLTHVLGRGGIGLGQGLMLPVGPVYLGELAPKEIRGTMMSFWQLFYSVGALLSYLVGLITTNQPSLGNWQWRWVILCQTIAPLVFFICIGFCPESPRWLILKGRNDEARVILHKIRADEDVEDEIEEMIEVIERERATNPGTFAAYKMIFTQWNIAKRLLMAMVINFGQQATGQNSLNNYSSQIYKTIFSQNNVAIINVVNSICGILFTLNSTIFVDRVGRISLFIGGAIGMAICTAAAAILYDYSPDKTSYNLGIGLAVILFIFIFFYKPTWGATTWIYTGEIFPIVVRAQAVGIASQTQNIASLILGQLFPIMFTDWSFNVFFFFTAVNVLLAVIIWFYPETRGVMLEEIDELFDGKKSDSDLPYKR